NTPVPPSDTPPATSIPTGTPIPPTSTPTPTTTPASSGTSDTTPPVVTLTLPPPAHGRNGWFNAQDPLPVQVTVSADDATTGGSAITALACTVSNAPATLG